MAELPLDGVRLVTASALLDLASAAWVEALAERLAAAGVGLYAALSYDGRTEWEPPLAGDAAAVRRSTRTSAATRASALRSGRRRPGSRRRRSGGVGSRCGRRRALAARGGGDGAGGGLCSGGGGGGGGGRDGGRGRVGRCPDGGGRALPRWAPRPAGAASGRLAAAAAGDVGRPHPGEDAVVQHEAVVEGGGDVDVISAIRIQAEIAWMLEATFATPSAFGSSGGMPTARSASIGKPPVVIRT